MPRYAISEGARSRTAWRIFAALVTAVSVAWVIWLLVGVWPDLVAHSAQLRVSTLLLGLALSIAASWLTFEVFVILAHTLQASGLPRKQLAHVYFVAQLLKHLPGRVWGVGYQWVSVAVESSFGRWVLLNLSHMLLATFFALSAAWITLGFASGVRWGVLAVASFVCIAGVGTLLVLSRWAWGWLDALPTRVATLGRDMLGFAAQAPAAVWMRVFVLLSISSVFYYASWALYGFSYPSLGGSAGVRLCAMYMLAWFVGYLSLLTPSGLGVRELAFAWLAKDFPGDSVALMAVVGRASLLLVDIVLGLSFLHSSPKKR